MDRDVLVVGESLVDIVRGADGSTVEYAGGSAANVAVALARLGRPVRFATSFAEDARGRMVAEHLKGAGVELATDPLGAVLTPGADDVYALLNGLRGQATISYDVNARPAITGTGPDIVARVERMVAISDLVKASDEDLTVLYPDVDHLVAARNLLALGPAAVVVTRGADGAMWVGASGEVEVASLPVQVADTIGAGDTFGAALVDALWQRDRLGGDRREALRDLPADEVAEVLAHAARAAAVTVSRPGADPPYRHELTD